MLVRMARLDDCASLAEMRMVLWPDNSAEEHQHELVAILTGKKRLVMPLVIFVAQSEEGELLGFLEAGLRPCAEGCEPWQPVGYIEGWYVGESYRKHGIGRRLLEVAEEWAARGQGCVEMASDALLENHLSQRVHQALVYKVVERSVHYRKARFDSFLQKPAVVKNTHRRLVGKKKEGTALSCWHRTPERWPRG